MLTGFGLGVIYVQHDNQSASCLPTIASEEKQRIAVDLGLAQRMLYPTGHKKVAIRSFLLDNFPPASPRASPGVVPDSFRFLPPRSHVSKPAVPVVCRVFSLFYSTLFLCKVCVDQRAHPAPGDFSLLHLHMPQIRSVRELALFDEELSPLLPLPHPTRQWISAMMLQCFCSKRRDISRLTTKHHDTRVLLLLHPTVVEHVFRPRGRGYAGVEVARGRHLHHAAGCSNLKFLGPHNSSRHSPQQHQQQLG